MVSENSKASISFTITEVESIPCDLRGQTVIFDAEANLLSDPVKTPWAMPWVMDEISKLADGRTEIP